MHALFLALLGAGGAFIGLDVLLRVPSLWGYSAIVSGWILLALASIKEEL
jgi:hypothetical protein